MFEIYIINGNETTYIQDRKYRISTGKIHKEVNSIDSFDFIISYENPGWSKIVPFRTWVKVIRKDNGEVIFDGRALKPEHNMESTGAISQSFVCEGRLALMHDTRPYQYETISGTPKSIIADIINRSNTLSNHYADLSLGQCPDTGNWSLVISPETDYYDTMHKFVVDVLGYDHILNGSTLDIVKDAGEESKTVLRLGKNLTSSDVINDPTGIVSRIVPLGKTLEGATNGERLTVGYIDDPTLIAKYGIQMGSQTYDDIDDANQLKKQGANYLKIQKQENVSYKLTALDLSLIGLAPDDFKMGHNYRVINPIQNVDEMLKVSSVEIDPLDPTAPALTFGIKYKTGTDYTKDAFSDSNRIDELSKQTQNALNKVNGVSKLMDSTNKDVESIKGAQSDQDKLIKDLQDQLAKLQGQTGGEQYYEGNIIDVSEWQGTINWPTVVNAGLALASIRVQAGSSHEDLTYKTSIPSAISAGVNYAVYAYFKGISVDDAKTEATNFYNRAKSVIGSGKQPRFWMIDVEEQSMTDMRSGVSAYMDQLNSLGVPDNKIVLYIANHLYDSFNLNVSRAGSIVIPSYGKNDGTITGSTKPTHPYDLWQYTSTGNIAGITGNVDMNTDPSDRFKKSYLVKG